MKESDSKIAFSEAATCAMMMPDEVPWAQVSIEALRELVNDPPRCDDDQTVGPAYWEYALHELETRDREAAFAVATTWLEEARGDGWTRACAWRVVFERDQARAFSFLHENGADAHPAILARAIEVHELELRMSCADAAEGGGVTEARRWLADVARKRLTQCRPDNPFYKELDEALSSLQRYLTGARIA